MQAVTGRAQHAGDGAGRTKMGRTKGAKNKKLKFYVDVYFQDLSYQRRYFRTAKDARAFQREVEREYDDNIWRFKELGHVDMVQLPLAFEEDVIDMREMGLKESS
jgi:hypothetical protein